MCDGKGCGEQVIQTRGTSSESRVLERQFCCHVCRARCGSGRKLRRGFWLDRWKTLLVSHHADEQETIDDCAQWWRSSDGGSAGMSLRRSWTATVVTLALWNMDASMLWNRNQFQRWYSATTQPQSTGHDTSRRMRSFYNSGAHDLKHVS